MSVNATGAPSTFDRVGGWVTTGVASGGVLGAMALIAGAPLAAVAVVLGLLAVAAALARPELVPPVVLFLLYLDVPGVAVREYGAPASLAALIIITLAIPAADTVMRGGRLRFGWPVGLVGVFFVVQFASAIGSREIGVALDKVSPFLFEGLLLTILVLNAVRSLKSLERVLWGLLLAGTCLGAVSVFQQVTGTFDRPYGGFALVPVEFLRGIETSARLSGPFGDPNYYAQILLPLIPLGLIALGGEGRRHRRLVAGATLLILGGIVLTYSRGGALALVLMFCIAVVARRVRAPQVLLIVLAAAIAIAVVPDYRERITTIGSSFKGATQQEGSSQAADQAVRGRTGEMAAAGLVFLDHPLLGVGPGVFPFYYQEYIDRLGLEAHKSIRTGAERGEEARREAHNMFLGIAADLGLAGLAVFLAIIATAFAGLARARRRCAEEDPRLATIATALLIALAGYVIGGLFLSLAFERYFWLLIALCGVVVQLSRETQEPRARPIGRGATLARLSARVGSARP